MYSIIMGHVNPALKVQALPPVDWDAGRVAARPFIKHYNMFSGLQCSTLKPAGADAPGSIHMSTIDTGSPSGTLNSPFHRASQSDGPGTT